MQSPADSSAPVESISWDPGDVYPSAAIVPQD